MVVEDKGDIFNNHHTNTNFMINASDLYAWSDKEYPGPLKIAFYFQSLVWRFAFGRTATSKDIIYV